MFLTHPIGNLWSLINPLMLMGMAQLDFHHSYYKNFFAKPTSKTSGPNLCIICLGRSEKYQPETALNYLAHFNNSPYFMF